MENLNCIILEDEIPSVEELKYILKKYNINVLDSANDGETGFGIFIKLKPDIVFLDINMPKISGIELAKKIKEIAPLTIIIFVTAYSKYAVKAFDIGALDYILKPFDEERIRHTIERIHNVYNQNISEVINKILDKISNDEKMVKKIPCENRGKFILIDVDNIIFCYVKDGKTYIKTKEKSYMTRYTLHEVEEKTSLFKAHRSYLINLDKVKEFYSWFNGTYNIVMNDNEHSQIPISRKNVKILKDKLGF